MQRITNISVTERAALILRKHHELFKPRAPGDDFALAYISSFVNRDGSAVEGFRPGYFRHSLSPEGRDSIWVLAQPPQGPDFYFMPKFKWHADEHYIIDVASEPFDLLSIGPA